MNTNELMVRWRQQANADSWLARIGRHCSMALCIQIDQDSWYLRIERGVLTDVAQGPFHLRSADLIIAGPAASWTKFFTLYPPPGFHDLFAMSSYGHISVQGNQHLLREHLQFIRALLAIPRQLTSKPGVDKS